MPEPLVTIITPCLNSERYLPEAIESVRSQSLADFEHIIVDDGSRDRTRELIRRAAAEDQRVRPILSGSSQGSAAARNAALRQARGRYIAFLDSDDRWLPGKLERQVEFMRTEGVALSYAAYHRIDEDGHRISTFGVPDRVAYPDLLKTCYIGCLTAMVDREATGAFEFPLVARRQDWALWLRLLRQIDFAHGICEPLAEYRVRRGSLSGNKLTTARYTWRMYRDLEGLSWGRSAHSFAHYAVRGVLRHRFPALARRLGVLHPAGGSSDG